MESLITDLRFCIILYLCLSFRALISITPFKEKKMRAEK